MTFTEKFLRARPPIEVAGRSVKRYHVTPGLEGVEPEVEQAALAILPKLLPEPDGTPPATFVVLARCEEWEEFSTRLDCRPILGGVGNLDEGEIPSRGYHAMSLRLYDRREHTWTIYWITSLSGSIDPGVTGRFADGVGEFFGLDTHEGIPVLVRYTWSDITPAAARWAQAFSADDGRTWETNWIMYLTRT